MIKKLLNGQTIDTDYIISLEPVSGFGGNSICHWTGYAVTLHSYGKINVKQYWLPNGDGEKDAKELLKKEYDELYGLFIKKNNNNENINRQTVR